jgi:hypothetical protein
MRETYVHGYHPRENERLQDQAGTLVDLLHDDTAYPGGSTVLEAGCGVGAQTITLAERSPDARFTSVDVSAHSLVYVDSSRPDLVDGFTRKTFTAMIEGIREPAIASGLIDPERFDAGVRDLKRTTEADGVFSYTFFRGIGEKQQPV